jgi:hypothetical protein
VELGDLPDISTVEMSVGDGGGGNPLTMSFKVDGRKKEGGLGEVSGVLVVLAGGLYAEIICILVGEDRREVGKLTSAVACAVESGVELGDGEEGGGGLWLTRLLLYQLLTSRSSSDSSIPRPPSGRQGTGWGKCGCL